MSPAIAVRRCVIYARLSVSSEESVSIARQVEAAEQYAAARGWQVVGTFTDDGVSATHNRPEDRPGWRELLAASGYDAVIIWKVDRLARRVLDFLTADAALQERKAGIVAVEQSIDMTTPEGRGFAQMLAVFAEMEAAAIAARVRAARTHLIRAGRVVGGAVPYGWRSVPNPDGSGLVLATDPERIGYVRGMAERVLRGETVYAVKQWLDEVGAPLPTASQRSRKNPGWRYKTVEGLLRNPVLAGMTAFNPGNGSKQRGAEVLRDADGLPVVDESVAILSAAEWRRLVHLLDTRDSAQSRPRALRAKTSALLSGLVRCGECDVRMHRGTTQGRESYHCPRCYQTISNIEAHVVSEFLARHGNEHRWSVIEEVHEGGAALLPEIEHALATLTAELQATDDDARAEQITEQIAALRRKRREAREAAPVVSYREVRETQTFGEDWADAEDVMARRAVLDDALAGITVRRGRTGRGLDTSRLSFDWRRPAHLPPTDAQVAEQEGA
ncbi:MAG: recombinase family protein [Nocardioidaceae bacterium]